MSESVDVSSLPYVDECPAADEAGIYYLLRRGRIVYVGQSGQIRRRVSQHARRKIFDSARLYAMPSSTQDERERLERAETVWHEPDYNFTHFGHLKAGRGEALVRLPACKLLGYGTCFGPALAEFSGWDVRRCTHATKRPRPFEPRASFCYACDWAWGRFLNNRPVCEELARAHYLGKCDRGCVYCATAGHIRSCRACRPLVLGAQP